MLRWRRRNPGGLKLNQCFFFVFFCLSNPIYYLNKKLHTFERIQSDKRYNEIEINNLTSDNLISKRKWLLNITHQGSQSSINEKRIELSMQMRTFIENSNSNMNNTANRNLE